MATTQPGPDEPGFDLWNIGYQQGLQESRAKVAQELIQHLTDKYMEPDLAMDTPEGAAIRALLTATGKFLRGEK